MADRKKAMSPLDNPGKYEAACTEARERTKAKACALIIGDGEFGHGFSVQVDVTHPGYIASLPALLRAVADNIDAQIAELQGSLAE